MINGDKNLKSAETFKLRLAQTILWCVPRVDITKPEDCLRTLDLRPHIFERDRFSALDSVADARQFCGGDDFRHAQVPKDLSGGRLFAFFPESNLYDGAAELASEGFLDSYNIPPWDTWVAYFEDDSNTGYGSYLISWIPPEFIEPVADGIAVNPEECIMWLSDADVSFKYDSREGWFKRLLY